MNVVICIRPTFTQDKELASDKDPDPCALCGIDSQEQQLPPSWRQQHSDQCQSACKFSSTNPRYEKKPGSSMENWAARSRKTFFKKFILIRRNSFSVPDSITEYFSYCVEHRNVSSETTPGLRFQSCFLLETAGKKKYLTLGKKKKSKTFSSSH